MSFLIFFLGSFLGCIAGRLVYLASGLQLGIVHFGLGSGSVARPLYLHHRLVLGAGPLVGHEGRGQEGPSTVLTRIQGSIIVVLECLLVDLSEGLALHLSLHHLIEPHRRAGQGPLVFLR